MVKRRTRAGVGSEAERTYDDDDDDDDNNNNLLCRFDLQFTCWFDGVNNVFLYPSITHTHTHTHVILPVNSTRRYRN